MNFPGFTAEAALVPASGRYTSGASQTAGAEPAITEAQRLENCRLSCERQGYNYKNNYPAYQSCFQNCAYPPAPVGQGYPMDYRRW